MKPKASARSQLRRFRLTRFFSVASFVGIVIVTACLLWVYRDFTVRQLIDHESRANEHLTQAFANAVWDEYRPFVVGSRGWSRDALLAAPMVARLRSDVLGKLRGLKVAKLRIYNLEGLTVFSTEERQIGEDKADNPGFRAAREGRIVSEIIYRDTFDAFEGTLSQRNLIFSYIPLRSSPAAAPEGVFEVYSDVTDLLQQQRRAQWEIAALVLFALGTLYLLLFFVARKAERIIAGQEREREQKEEQIHHLAYHDALTDLPHRTYFTERLNELLALARRHGRIVALLFIDLDRFKIVNDSLGHGAGDLLLKTASERIRACLRSSDLLFRMGGDEFMVILPEIAAPEDAAYVAQRVKAALASPIPVYEHEIAIGATIGIAVFPGDGDDAATLSKNADAAMYSAKQNARGNYSFYRKAMSERALQRLGLESALRKAFRDGEFTLHYQPRLDARTRRVLAAEALLRWISPSRGLVSPGEFIQSIEEMGMMPIVGEWVLRTACAQQRRWQQHGLENLRVSVNVSARQFQGHGFAATVSRVLAETGVAPSSLELELTESLLITNAEQARVTIDALKALGVQISIDDFGTGYSSLNYLRHLSVDYLKIDRSFVTEIATSPRDRAVATAIVELAQALHITVVAEGVETEAQAAFFSAIHCGELQGFLFCKPLPAEQLIACLSAVGTCPTTSAGVDGFREQVADPASALASAT